MYFTDILYADDTMLVGKNERTLQLLLHPIERHARRYGLKLIESTCVHINMICNAKIRFADNTEMKNTSCKPTGTERERERARRENER